MSNRKGKWPDDKEKVLWWNYVIGQWYLSGAKIPSRTKLNQSWERLKDDKTFWFQTVIRHSGEEPLSPIEMGEMAVEGCIANFQGIILDDLQLNNYKKEQK